MKFFYAGLLACCLLLTGAIHADTDNTTRAEVIAVLDGDTLLLKHITDGDEYPVIYKLRLADIDAPEQNQRFGEQSKQALAKLTLHQRVRVRTIATDTYGREIGWVTLARDADDSVAINYALVRHGWAWALSRRRSPSLQFAQRLARDEKKGLWADAEPVPPWVWRKQHLPQPAIH